MANPFMWVELHTQDTTRAKEFYSKLFAWELKDVPIGSAGSYTMIAVGEGTGGGIMKDPRPTVPSHWLAYVVVDDVVAATKMAEQLGAKVLQGRTEVGGFGSLSVIADPTGAVLGLWERKK